MKGKQKHKLFVDFDGTLAEFRRSAGPDTYSRKGYSRELRPFENVIKAIKNLSKMQMFDVYLCSAVLPYDYVVDDKNWWLDKYLPEIPKENRLYVKYGESKIDCVKSVGVSTGDVFLDDYNPNLTDIASINVVEPVKLVNDINDNSHEWRGAKVHFDTDAEEIMMTLYGLSLARQR